jgi:hypothetical protein
MVLTWSEKGKSRLLSLPSERVGEVKKKSEEYLLESTQFFRQDSLILPSFASLIFICEC